MNLAVTISKPTLTKKTKNVANVIIKGENLNKEDNNDQQYIA